MRNIGIVAFFLITVMLAGSILPWAQQNNNYYFPRPNIGIRNINGFTGNFSIISGDGNLTIKNSSSGNLIIYDPDAKMGMPAGSNTAIQFNNNGIFGGSNSFTYNSAINLVIAPNLNTTGDTLISRQRRMIDIHGNTISGANSPFSFGQSGFINAFIGSPDMEVSQGAYGNIDTGWIATQGDDSKIGMYNGGAFISSTLPNVQTPNTPVTQWCDLAEFNYPTNVGDILLGDPQFCYNGYVLNISSGGEMNWTGILFTTGSVNATSSLDIGTTVITRFNNSGVATIYNGKATSPQGNGLSPILSAADLTGRTIAQNTICTYTPGKTGTFSITGYVAVNSISIDTMQFQTVFTNELGTLTTQTMYQQGVAVTTGGTISSTGFKTYPTFTVRDQANKAITVNTILTNLGGSINYDVGCTISELS